jgi:hypothetical protein
MIISHKGWDAALKRAVMRVNPEYFSWAIDAQELETLINQERQSVLTYLERTHQDIFRNFDPRVRRFRRKRKIILADGTWKDLL